MFTIEIDVEAAQQRIETMIEDVVALDEQVPDEFVVWQREDMNRRYPNIEEAGTHSWITKIWPRSRLSDKRTPEQKRRRRRALLFTPIANKGGAGRPILREELFDALGERMRALLDAVTWKKE